MRLAEVRSRERLAVLATPAALAMVPPQPANARQAEAEARVLLAEPAGPA